MRVARGNHQTEWENLEIWHSSVPRFGARNQMNYRTRREKSFLLRSSYFLFRIRMEWISLQYFLLKEFNNQYSSNQRKKGKSGKPRGLCTGSNKIPIFLHLCAHQLNIEIQSCLKTSNLSSRRFQGFIIALKSLYLCLLKSFQLLRSQTAHPTLPDLVSLAQSLSPSLHHLVCINS